MFHELSREWPRLRLIIVPRHPERFDSVARMLDASGVAWQRRTLLEAGRGIRSGVGEQGAGRPCPPLPAADSSLPAGYPLGGSPLSPRVLLVDVVGELGAWWGTAHIAFVGGSLGNRGGQNMIEPAAYGLPCRSVPTRGTSATSSLPSWIAMRPLWWPMASSFGPSSAGALQTPLKRPPVVSVPQAWFANSLGPRSELSICSCRWFPANGPRPMAIGARHELCQ